MRIQPGTLFTSTALITGLLRGCSLAMFAPSVTAWHERPVVIATPTPAGAKLSVTQAYEQEQIGFSTTTGALGPDHTLGLDLSARPLGVFIVVAAEIHNTGNVPLHIGSTDLSLEDVAGLRYPRVAAAELVLALLDTPTLSNQSVPPGGRAAGLAVFDASPTYAAPLHLVAYVPGQVTLRSAPFSPEKGR